MKTAHPWRPWLDAVGLLCALLTPLFVNLWVEQQFEASKVWLLRTLSWGLAWLWLAGWLAGEQPRALPATVRRLTVGLGLVVALATLQSAYPYIALWGSLERANGAVTQVSYLLLFGCVATSIDGPGSRRLLTALALTAVPIGLVALAQAAGWQPLPMFTDARSPLITTLGRANFTGAYLALLLPLTLAAAQTATRRRQRAAFGAVFALAAGVIAMTGARAAWVAAAVGVGAYLWLMAAPGWTRRARWATVLAGLAALAGGLGLWLQQGHAAGGSIAARWTIWRAALQLLWPHVWLGYGADTLELYFPAVYPPELVYYQGRGVVVDRAHNWLLDWPLNYGVVATAIFIALVVVIAGAGWRRLAHPPAADTGRAAPPLERHWLAACLAVIGAQWAGNLFLFEVAATAVVFWLTLAICVAATTQAGPPAAPPRWPRWGRAVALGAGLALFGWAVGLGNLRPLLADAQSWRGTQALNQGDRVTAEQAYAAAAALEPQRAAYHLAEALTAAALGRTAQAETALAAALAAQPADPRLYTYLGDLYAREAETEAAPATWEAAYAAYEQALALAPTLALTYRAYADAALRAGDSDRARQQAQRAVDLDATDGVAFGILGWAQLAAGQPAAAEHAFAQAVRWEPGWADFQLGLATAYYQQGQTEAARQAVARSLQLDPAYAPALALQAQLADG